MARPPGGGHSLEDSDQLGHGAAGQDGGLGTWLGGQIGAGDGEVAELAGGEFDLAMADLTRQVRQAYQLQDPAIQRMARVGNGDVALAHLRDQRCITLAGVSPSPVRRAG
jgi:hypothetical protein